MAEEQDMTEDYTVPNDLDVESNAATDVNRFSNLETILKNMIDAKRTHESSGSSPAPRPPDLPAHIVLPKIIKVMPTIPTMKNQGPRKTLRTPTMPTPLYEYQMLFGDRVSDALGDTTNDCNSSIDIDGLFDEHSTLLSEEMESESVVDGDEQCVTKPQVTISMKGCPVVVNGEKGVFLSDNALKRKEVNAVLKRNLVNPEAQIYTSILPSQQSIRSKKSVMKTRRNIGVSTELSVPIEIGPYYCVNKPPIVQPVQMRRNADDSITFTTTAVVSDQQRAMDCFTQTCPEDLYNFDEFREKCLPKSDRYRYNYTTIDLERSLIEFRVSGITSKQAADEWVQQLEAINNSQFRVWKTFKLRKADAYKTQLRCHMNQGKTRKSMKGKDLGCSSMLALTIEPLKLSKGVPHRSLRERFRCKVRFRFEHNHSEEESLKHMSVRKDVREKIMKCFQEGMSVSDTYSKHYQDLKDEYGPRYYEMMCNRGICPDKGYFYNIWKVYSTQTFGSVIKPPKSLTPKVPWNKGLRGITSLKEFFPIADEPPEDGQIRKKDQPGKKERIRRAALDGVDSTLMESIRQNPETYSKAVACFVEVWKTMDDKERLIWLQTKIENDIPQRVALVPADQIPVDENMHAAQNILLDDFTEHSYSDIVVAPSHHPPPAKRTKMDQPSSSRTVTEFTFQVSESGLPFYRVTNAT